MSQSLNFRFDNSYARFPERFFTDQQPTPVSAPELIAFNTALATQLGLDASAATAKEGISVLAGNAVPAGSNPIATAYAGHQFGGWNPQLGDGRAVLLGEVLDKDGKRYDIQLKGAGRTPYSRGGDGRSPIGPVVREYIVSEAMHALGIPTTRALAAVSTGDPVFRENSLPGGVLTRVADSHIRVGTFQYFAARGDHEAIALLVEHVIERHYPELAESDNPSLSLLETVLRKQAKLIAQWQSIGFIHGVMNTDNCSVAGLTIDYGPCAFMDEFNTNKVFSSIDHQGRYAYKNQPGIVQWNIANFAQCLLPQIHTDDDAALEQAQAVINSFPEIFVSAYLEQFRLKLGLATELDEDAALIDDLLSCMEEAGADFTNTFRALSHCSPTDEKDTEHDSLFLQHFNNNDNSSNWLARWRQRQQKETNAGQTRTSLMTSNNPAYIPRNHRIEQVIRSAEAGGYASIEELAGVLSEPYREQAGKEHYAQAPESNEVVKATFCGT